MLTTGLFNAVCFGHFEFLLAAVFFMDGVLQLYAFTTANSADSVTAAYRAWLHMTGKSSNAFCTGVSQVLAQQGRLFQ